MSKSVLFLAQFVLIGLGIAFVWLLFHGQFTNDNSDEAVKPVISGPIQQIDNKNQTNDYLARTITHSGHLSFASAVEIAQPAVVSIITATITEDQLVLTPNGVRPGFKPGLGSGVIVDKQGYILTNHHVIQNVDSIGIVHTDGRAVRARVVGTDPDTDLALLFVPSLADKAELQTLDFANSDNLHIGDIVLAIGNQFGIGQTVTQGIVSATGRRTNTALAQFEDFIQTDANISSGNSGGALINTNGELIGINTAELSREGQRAGIGFAIPSNLAKGVFEELKAHGRVIRGWLGVSVGRAPVGLTNQLGVEADYIGTMIGNVEQESPAEKSGLRTYDIITSVNGETIQRNSESQTMHLIASLKPGETARLGIRRGNQLLDVDVLIEEKPLTDDQTK